MQIWRDKKKKILFLLLLNNDILERLCKLSIVVVEGSYFFSSCLKAVRIKLSRLMVYNSGSLDIRRKVGLHLWSASLSQGRVNGAIFRIIFERLFFFF